MSIVKNAPTVSAETPAAFRLLSSREVKAMLGVSRGTFFKFVNSKVDPLPSLRLGRCLKFRMDQILWWLSKREQ